MSGSEITIVIVEDQLVIRVGLRLMLEKYSDLIIVDEADNGQNAINIVSNLHPQVVVMDIGLPDMDGIEAARQIKTVSPQTRMLMFTASDRDDDIFSALAAGADGYCLKNATDEQIAIAIRAVANGVAWLDPGIAKRVLGACKAPTVNQTRRGRFALSAAELEILELIVGGLSSREIATRLGLNPENAAMHVRHIMEKLVVPVGTGADAKSEGPLKVWPLE